MSTIGVRSSSVIKIYDSIKSDALLPMDTKNVLAALLCPEQQNVKVSTEDVQQQSDGSSCGLICCSLCYDSSSGRGL